VKAQRPGASGPGSEGPASAGAASPGKRTLVDGLDANAAAPVGQAIAIGGGPQVEGGTLFSGPDATISAAVPGQAAATPDVTDADYETMMGIKTAIDGGKMVAIAGVNGQTFTATGCAGKKDGKVAFTFDRAFVGDYEYAAAGKSVRGVHVCISAALSGCGEHTEVKLIQILRNFTKKDGKAVTADPTDPVRRTRSGWGDAAAPSRGWRVDGLTDKTTPFYTENSTTSDVYGQHGSSTKAAKLRDTPGDWSTSRNVGKEFRTCAVSYAGGKGTVLACVEWGYYIDDAGHATMYPATPVTFTGSVTELNDAATRWDGIAGNTNANLSP
jgi:hypothetical protein